MVIHYSESGSKNHPGGRRQLNMHNRSVNHYACPDLAKALSLQAGVTAACENLHGYSCVVYAKHYNYPCRNFSDTAHNCAKIPTNVRRRAYLRAQQRKALTRGILRALAGYDTNSSALQRGASAAIVYETSRNPTQLRGIMRCSTLAANVAYPDTTARN